MIKTALFYKKSVRFVGIYIIKINTLVCLSIRCKQLNGTVLENKILIIN